MPCSAGVYPPVKCLSSGVSMPFKIRTKLIIAFLVVIFPFTAVTGIIAFYNASNIRKANLKAEAVHEEMHLIMSLQIALDRILMPGNDYIITGDKKYIDEFKDNSKDVEDLIQDVENTLVILKGMDTPDRFIQGQAPEVREEVEILSLVKAAWTNIKEISQKIFEIQNPIGSIEAARLMEEMDYKWAYPAIRALDEHHEIDRKGQAKALKQVNRAWKAAWLIMLAGGVILLAASIFFAVFYSNLFVRPIKAIHNGADAIAGGNFKTRLDVKTGDEIEQLSNAMNEMAAQLDNFYATLEEQVRERTGELMESEERLRTLTETAGDAIICMSAPDTIYMWNKKAEEMFGYTAEEAIGRELHKLIVPDVYREKAHKGMEGFLKTGSGAVLGKTVEVKAMRRDGTEFPVELSVSAMNIKGEWHATGIIRDITERKKAEEALRESEERYRSLFENMLEGFAYCKMLFDEQDRPVNFLYLDVNAAFERLTGLKNVVGKQVTEVIPGIKESSPELFDIYGRVALTGKSERFEIDFKSLALWLSISVYSMEKGYFIAVFDNITERKKAEQGLAKHVDELERYMKATVQREFRIKELRDKVKELEEELKKAKG